MVLTGAFGPSGPLPRISCPEAQVPGRSFFLIAASATLIVPGVCLL